MTALELHKRYVGCRRCGTMVPVVLPQPSDAAEVRDAYLEDWYAFWGAHAGHGLIELACLLEAPMRGGPLWDPMASIEFELVGGGATFLACGRRASIAAPRRYTFAPGALHRQPPVVELDADDVRRALGMELAPEGVAETQIDALLQAMRRSLEAIAGDEIAIAFDDVDDPEVGVAPLPDPALRRILDAAAAIFDAGARRRIERFVIENRGEDGVLAVRVRRRAVPVPA